MATLNNHSGGSNPLGNQVDTPSDVSGVEIITVWRGKDMATYIGSEYRELGDKAKPIRIVQDPRKNEPWTEIKTEDVDTIEFYSPETKPPGTDLPKWDLDALKGLLEAQEKDAPAAQLEGSDGK